MYHWSEARGYSRPHTVYLFLTAVMIKWRATTSLPLCIFRSKQDAKLTGRSYRAYGEEYEFQDSEYANNTALVFDSREDALYESF